jgi:hypothetical protein
MFCLTLLIEDDTPPVLNPDNFSLNDEDSSYPFSVSVSSLSNFSVIFRCVLNKIDWHGTVIIRSLFDVTNTLILNKVLTKILSLIGLVRGLSYPAPSLEVLDI